MPIFEYRCGSCGKRFEALLARAEAEEAQACPACGAPVGGKDRPGDRLLSVFAAARSTGEAEAAPAAGDCGEGACGADFG